MLFTAFIPALQACRWLQVLWGLRWVKEWVKATAKGGAQSLGALGTTPEGPARTRSQRTATRGAQLRGCHSTLPVPPPWGLFSITTFFPISHFLKGEIINHHGVMQQLLVSILLWASLWVGVKTGLKLPLQKYLPVACLPVLMDWACEMHDSAIRMHPNVGFFPKMQAGYSVQW